MRFRRLQGVCFLCVFEGLVWHIMWLKLMGDRDYLLQTVPHVGLPRISVIKLMLTMHYPSTVKYEMYTMDLLSCSVVERRTVANEDDLLNLEIVRPHANTPHIITM